MNFDYTYHRTWKEQADREPSAQEESDDEYQESLESGEPETELHHVDEQASVPEIQIRRLQGNAKIPYYTTPGAAGCDLTIPKEVILAAFERTLVGTGITIAILKGYYGQIKPRSSLALAGITVDGGVIDSDYRGEVMVIMANTTPKEFSLEKNSRIA